MAERTKGSVMRPGELIDQLVTGDLPLAAIRSLIPDQHAMHAIVRKHLLDATVEVLDEQGRALKPWEWDTLCRDRILALGHHDRMMFHLTEKGRGQWPG